MKKAIGCLLAFLLIFCTASCSGETYFDTGEEESGSSYLSEYELAHRTRLKLFAPTSQIALFNQDIRNYEELHPQIKVEAQYISDQNFESTMAIWLSSSSDVDIVWASSNGSLKTFMQQGFLQPIDLSDIPPATLASSEDALDKATDSKGSTYALPLISNCWMLFYNKTLFQENGIREPGYMTWEDYRKLAVSLTNAQNWGGMFLLETLNLGAIPAGEYLDQEELLVRTREYVSLLHELCVEDASHLPISEISSYDFDPVKRFARGDVYMMLCQDSMIKDLLASDLPFEFALAPLPVFEGVEEGVTVGSRSYLCVAAKSKHPREAYRFMEFCCLSEEGTINIVKNFEVPICYTAASLDIYNESASISGIEYRFLAGICDESGESAQYSRLDSIFTEEMTAYLNQEQDLDSAFLSFYARKNYVLGLN